MSAVMRLPWQRPLPSNGALNIQQLWASGGRTREPILMKFGKQTQIRTTMTVTYQILKVGVRSLLESIRNAITRLQMDRLGRNLVVASHHVPNIGNTITPLTMGPIGRTLGWLRPSNTSAATPFNWYWSLLLTAQRTFKSKSSNQI